MTLLRTVGFSIRTARLGEVPRWPAVRVAKLQQRRLRSLVRFAIARSPYYRDKYRGIDPHRFALRDLPPTNKAELMSRFDDVVTDRQVRRADVEVFVNDLANLGRWFRGRYAVSHTSGSQGQPLLIVQDRRALEILFGIMGARANAHCRPNVLEALRRLRTPAKVAIVALKRAFFPSGAAFEFMSHLMGPYVRVLWLSSMQPDLAGQLNDFQPNMLVGYASVLEALALERDRLQLRDLRQIANSSEQLTERARGRIEAAFGVPLLDHYGMGECLLLSDGCPTDGGAHVNADWAMLEVVDDDYRPVPAGVLGKKVLVTNLANRVQPFIRYEVTDQLTLATEPCGCGSRLPRIAHIEGRAAELFWVEAQQGYRMVSGVLFHNAIDSLGSVREWQAIQFERNSIEVRLALLGDAPLDGAPLHGASLHQALRRKLEELGLPANLRVDVQIVSSLRPDVTTGKFRRMISLVGPPANLGQPGSDRHDLEGRVELGLAGS